MGPLATVADYLRQVAAGIAAKSDAELLRQYVQQRDDESFAILVHRHGPMVLGVCRRALGASPSAEDAFQATFLALSRNAAKIDDCVPGWLYRVAVRTARKALRREAAEYREVADGHDPFAEVEWRDLRRLLDEELDRLPPKLRTPLVLCYLEGQTREEAANQLNCSLRTLHRNLALGRNRLRERLVRRGLGAAALAVAVLTPKELCARVPAALAANAITLNCRESVVPESVRLLQSKPPALRGLAMKTSLCGLVLAGGIVGILIVRQPVAADPVTATQPNLSTQVALAPTIRPKPDPFLADVKKAQEKGIARLKALQKEQSKDVWNWEDAQNPLQLGGASSLALLALLENGEKVDDEIVARGIKYLRTVEPANTYVVALQTQVLCKANQKQDAERVKRNVKWLEDAACWNGDKLIGWSYAANPAGRGDGSNSRYAIAALYDAHKVGFKVKNARFWQQVADHYIATQQRDGGWGYVGVSKPSHTMTFSGALCLTLASNVNDKEDKATATALKSAYDWIGIGFKLEQTTSNFYNFDVVAALGRASEKSDFGSKEKKVDWYREGAIALLKMQTESGGWKLSSPMDNIEVISTSFALRFLASRGE